MQRIQHYGGRYRPGCLLTLNSDCQAHRRYPARMSDCSMTCTGIRCGPGGLPTKPPTVVFHSQSVTSTVARQPRPPTGEQPVAHDSCSRLAQRVSDNGVAEVASKIGSSVQERCCIGGEPGSVTQ